MNFVDLLVIIFFFINLIIVFVKFFNVYKVMLEPYLNRYSRDKKSYEPIYPIPVIIIGLAISFISWTILSTVLNGQILLASNNINNSQYFSDLMVLTVINQFSSLMLVLCFVLSVAELFTTLSRFSFKGVQRFSDYAQKRR